MDAVDSLWIAIEPPVRGAASAPSVDPPSFGQSQFDVVLRRQRMRPKEGGGLKLNALPSRFINLSNDFEFAGWGGILNLKLDPSDHDAGDEKLRIIRRDQILGQFLASGLAGNDILGGVFYTLPAVVSVSSVYSPISLLVATLILFLWRPIMEELASAFPISGAPYTYLLNVSSKPFALIGASLLLLDFASTSVVSAATASAYLSGEVTLPFPPFVGAVFVFVIFAAISFCGIKENTRIALGVLTFHIVTMTILVVASAVHWGQVGSTQLKENWRVGQAPSVSVIARQVFNGICIGVLGLTGFECTPAYIAKIKPGRFPSVLRNLHYPAIIVNATLMLLLLALIPLQTILQGANVLSILAQVVSGKWLRIWIVIDAIVVLCSGVLTGILSACELFEQLAHDRVIPKIFLHSLPITDSPYISVISFIGFSGIIYASASASLSIVSQMFSLVWLTVMALFPLSLLLLRYSRGRLPRQPRTSLCIIFSTIATTITIFIGNVIIDPNTIKYFSLYFVGILVLFSATQNKIHLLRWIYWTYDQYPALHNWSWTKTWGKVLIRIMTRLKRQPVCILTKTDEINHLFQMILYVRKNEETSSLKIVYFNDGEKGIPSELEANAKILDEAFPDITVDLILVEGAFEPRNVAALAHRLNIPRSLMFMSCPGADLRFSVAELGTRIIIL